MGGSGPANPLTEQDANIPLRVHRDKASSRVFLQSKSAGWLPVRMDLTPFPSHVDIRTAVTAKALPTPAVPGKMVFLGEPAAAELKGPGRDPALQTSPVTCLSQCTGSILLFTLR